MVDFHMILDNNPSHWNSLGFGDHWQTKNSNTFYTELIPGTALIFFKALIR